MQYSKVIVAYYTQIMLLIIHHIMTSCDN